jgi:hypothetical protein
MIIAAERGLKRHRVTVPSAVVMAPIAVIIARISRIRLPTSVRSLFDPRGASRRAIASPTLR